MGSFGVIGLGQLGSSIARALAEGGAQVVALDIEMARVEALKGDVTHAACLDATDERALKASGIGDCPLVVLAFGEQDLERAVLTTMLLRDMGVGRIIARVSSATQARVLEKLGVHKTVYPEKQVGEQLARQLLAPRVREVIPIGEGIKVADVEVGKGAAGKSLVQLEVRRRFGVNVIAVTTPREETRDDGSTERSDEVDNLPGPDTRLRPGSRLVVVGSEEGVEALSREIG